MKVGINKFFTLTWWKVTIIVLLLLLLGSYFTLAVLYQNQVFPGVRVGEIILSGQDRAGTERLINQATEQLKQGLEVYYGEQRYVLTKSITSFDIDLSYELYWFDLKATVDNVYNFGRVNNFFVNFKNRLQALIFGYQLPLRAEPDQERLVSLLKANFASLDIPAKEADLVKDQYGNFSVTPEKAGQAIDYQRTLAEIKIALTTIKLEPIALQLKIIEPQIKQADALNVDNQAKTIIALAPLNLTYQNRVWTVDQATLSDWLTLKNKNQKKQITVYVSLSENKIKTYLDEIIGLEINQAAQEAKLQMSGGKVTVFQRGQNGQELASALTAEKIINETTSGNSQIELIVEQTEAETSLEEIDRLSIMEIVGTGRSNFAGSPKNRRHNIKIGAASISGLLIKPGAEFSLLKALLPVNAATGYLPELVIKENKTVPEYGGGLCQIGTTIFRVALAAGLPITQRRNHSYRVVYYEPAGTDATIYDPSPDFRFINDYQSHLLLQTRIEGDNLIFDLWGTKDGRQIEQSKPVIYNITKPEPTKIVETLDLKPGEKKCTEKPHNGADTYFDYKVTYASNEVKKNRFSSHYVPWQEVCLLGVEQLTTDKPLEEQEGFIYQKKREVLQQQAETGAP